MLATSNIETIEASIKFSGVLAFDYLSVGPMNFDRNVNEIKMSIK